MRLLIILCAVFLAMPVMADDKIDHYEGRTFENKKEAFRVLKETSAEMARVASEEVLSIAKMEKIHQTSYTTEDAIAFLGKKGKYDLSDLAVKLEEVHLASEDHKAEDLRRYFISYQAELTNYIASK